jgi:glycosyltransferase involved in cell wall biosynthesis
MPNATTLQEGAGTSSRPGGALAGKGAGAAAPASKPHICFVAPYLWPVLARDASIKVVGGAEVQQAVLARLFRRAGYRVSAICQSFGQPRRAEVDGIEVHSLYRQEDGLPILRFFHPRLTRMWQALVEVDADIYYQRSAAHLTGVIAEFCRRHGKRSVYAGASDRDFLAGQQQIRYRRDVWLYEHGLRRVDRIVAQNALQRESCLRYYGREPVVIPSCYEVPADSRIAREGIVLWVGTIHTYKQPEMLLEIARRLPGRRFVMIGGSAAPGEHLRRGYFEGVREAAARLPNVEFKGFLPLAEVEPWFDRASVLVNTSVYEGMPNVFLQAWARGVPTVATVDVGAEGAYKRISTEEEAAQEIEKLFSDELHRARASARCREYFERSHSSAEVLARYGRLFDELVSGPSA